jgi:hypothetical protein
MTVVELERVDVSQREFLADVLRELNQLLTSNGLDSVYEIPRGFQRRSQQCPIARAAEGRWFVGAQACYWKDDCTSCFELPDLLQTFVHLFDKGLFPELIDEIL